MPVAVAGALVVAVAVIGALALRSPAPAAAPRSSAPLTGSPPLVLDLPAHPRGGEAALAAVSADIGAGRRAQGRDGPPARARRCSARATCACRSRARCCATARARWTPRSACCARSCPTTTALPCRRCTSGWRCSGPGSAAEATAELRADALARPRRPLRAHRRQRPAPVVPQELPALGALALRARLASRSCARGPRPRRARCPHSSTTPTPCSSARARAPASWPRRRSRSTPATSTPRWP